LLFVKKYFTGAKIRFFHFNATNLFYIFAISNIPKRSALGKAVAVAGIAMAAVSMVEQEYSRRILR